MRPLPVPLQARSLLTRQRLLDAAARCLASGGLAAFSTLAVAREAGVSQGALFKHFPMRVQLLAETVAHILRSTFDRFDEAANLAVDSLEQAPLDVRISVSVRALWAIFSSDALRGAFEVYVAARTDPELEGLLAPIIEGHSERLYLRASTIFSEFKGLPDDRDVVNALMLAMQGATIGVFGDLRQDDLLVAFFEQMLRRELTALAAQRSAR